MNLWKPWREAYRNRPIVGTIVGIYILVVVTWVILAVVGVPYLWFFVLAQCIGVVAAFAIFFGDSINDWRIERKFKRIDKRVKGRT
jgi:hypothetical protein